MLTNTKAIETKAMKQNTTTNTMITLRNQKGNTSIYQITMLDILDRAKAKEVIRSITR